MQLSCACLSMYFGIAADGKDCLVRMVMAVEWKDLWIICMAIAVWIRKSYR